MAGLLFQERPTEGTFLSKIEISPLRRRERRGRFFFFGGERPPKKKPSVMSEVYLVQSQSNRMQFESIPEGMNLVIQAPLTIGSQRNISQRPLRLRGEPGFERCAYKPKRPMKSAQLSRNSVQFGQQWPNRHFLVKGMRIIERIID